MKYIIYIIANSVNNRIYVGATEEKWKKWRKSNHFNKLKASSHHSYKLQKDYLIYGPEAFILTTIEEGEGSWEFRNDRESYWISFFDSYRNGYNCTIYATHRPKWSEEERKKTSERIKRDFQTGKRKPVYPKGTKRDPALMAKINAKKRIPILQIGMNGNVIREWKGAYEASYELKIVRTAIHNCLKGRSKSCLGCLWKYKHAIE